MNPQLPLQRDEALAEALRLGGAAVRLDGVDWEGLRQTITSRARAERYPTPRFLWWEVAAQRRRLAVAASLGALLSAALLSRDRPADTPTKGTELVLPSESVALAHLVHVIQVEEGFTALIRASGGDLFAGWREP